MECEPLTPHNASADAGRPLPVLPTSQDPGGQPAAGQSAPAVPAGPPAGGGPVLPLRNPERETLESAVRSGVSWFFWIAGLSLINTVVFLTGGSISFVVGLGATQLIDAIVKAGTERLGDQGAMVLRIVGFVLDLVIAGFFVGVGLLGRRMHRWALILGMVVYALDAVIFVMAGAWLSVGFHAFALWGLWNGLSAMNKLRELDAREAPPAPPSPPPPAADAWQPPPG